nr:hypothetical protein [Pseudomonas mendocina]
MKSGVVLVAFCVRVKTYGALLSAKNHKAFSRCCLCGHEKAGLGVSSEERKRIEKTHSPIDEVWNLIAPAIPSVSKDQFFGFELIPGIEGVQHTQYGAICGAHVVLNMIGISPDKGLAKREKIKNIMSDGQHTGMASYCNALLSADRGIINKARCIYTYLGNITTPLHFNYEKGYILNLGIQIDKT